MDGFICNFSKGILSQFKWLDRNVLFSTKSCKIGIKMKLSTCFLWYVFTLLVVKMFHLFPLSNPLDSFIEQNIVYFVVYPLHVLRERVKLLFHDILICVSPFRNVLLQRAILKVQNSAVKCVLCAWRPCWAARACAQSLGYIIACSDGGRWIVGSTTNFGICLAVNVWFTI